MSQGRGVDRGAETVRRARATRRDEDRSGRDAGQQELEPAHLIAAARRRRPVFALEAEGGHAQRTREGRRGLERRGPLAQATRLERRAYLFAQQRRISHLNPDPEDADAGCHGLHPPRRAHRPQVRGRPARWPAPSPSAGRRILQDAGQGAGGNRRGPGRAQQARVTYIQTPAALADAVATLRREPLVAADTEAASFHRYHDRIFLVQLASPSLTAIIDPLGSPTSHPSAGCWTTRRSRRYSTMPTTTSGSSTGTTASGRTGCSTLASPPSSRASRPWGSRRCSKSTWG